MLTKIAAFTWTGCTNTRTRPCRLHTYVLMTNHVRLLISAERPEAPGALMKALGQRYVQYVNRTYRRSGTLWEGRFRSCLTQEETYLLACQRYIELNLVSAGMARHPAEYRWSSYRANARGEVDKLLQPHPLYDALGADAASRQAAYRELFRYELEPGLVDQIRRATNGNFVLGNECFAAQVTAALGRRARARIDGAAPERPAPRPRPPLHRLHARRPELCRAHQPDRGPATPTATRCATSTPPSPPTRRSSRRLTCSAGWKC